MVTQTLLKDSATASLGDIESSRLTKWEKEIVCYTGANNNAYPTLEFSTVVQDQARKRNHPNVSAGVFIANSKVVIARKINGSPHFNLASS